MRFKKGKVLLNSLFVLCLCYFLALSCKKCTNGFSISAILSDIPYDAKWQLPSPTLEQQEQIDQILSQRFSYLGKGCQTFAFASEDGEYVIKFLRRRFYKSYELFLSLPLPSFLDQIRKKNAKKLLEKIDHDCSCYKMALEKLPQEVTGLIYLHLRPKEGFDRVLTITDRVGISHQIPLNKTAFMIQKRAQSLASYLAQNRKKEELKETIRSLLHALFLCAKRGVFHTDFGFDHNVGLNHKKPILIDLGSFDQQEPECPHEVCKEKVKGITKQFRRFLEKKHPELISTLDEELDAL